MKKVLKWVAIIFAAIIVIYLIDTKGGKNKGGVLFAHDEVKDPLSRVQKQRKDSIQKIKDEKEERKEMLSEAFNADGSHKNLVKHVKNYLKDPESFKHVKTVYWDYDSKITIQMTYRGKNSFGATVTEMVLADAAEDGELLSVKKQ